MALPFSEREETFRDSDVKKKKNHIITEKIIIKISHVK